MDISVLTKDTLRIKGKQAAIINSPTSLLRTKTSVDAILELSSNENPDLTKIEEYRIVIAGQGEYEISGAKIESVKTDSDIVYSIHMDGLDVLLGRAEAIERLKDKLGKHHIAIIFIDGKLNEETLSIFEPSIIVLFGMGAAESAKVLGKEINPLPKYTTTFEKLPAEMEVVVLQ